MIVFWSVFFLLCGLKSLYLCFPGENGESEFLSGQSSVWQPGPVYVSYGGSGGSRGGSLHSGSHCAHHSPHIQVNMYNTLSFHLNSTNLPGWPQVPRAENDFQHRTYLFFDSCRLLLLLTFFHLYLNFLYASLFVRRKSKQAMRDYKKVQIQLENLETSVRDRCKKEFTGIVQILTSVQPLSQNKEDAQTDAFLPFSSFRPDDWDDGHVQWFGGFRDSLPGLPGICRAHFLPRPPGLATETRSGCSWESKADCGARAGSVVQSAQQ